MTDKNRNYKIIQPLMLVLAMMFFLSFVYRMTQGESLHSVFFWFMLLVFGIVAFAFRKQLPRDTVIWTIIGGIAVKIGYIIYTDTWERQHDVICFGASEGHAPYIEYLLNNRALPDFDPRTVWAFFQPPLHHIIGAVWMGINARLGVAKEQMEENVQVLTLVYMVLLTLTVYYICKELHMQTRGTLITMIIVSFHPIYIMLSGSINNDALSICLTAIALYIAILWYKKPGFVAIILLGLCVGFSMMAKLSSGLVAPGIAVLMLFKLWEERAHFLKIIAQFAAFGLVVFPIGLWWPVRNKIMWDMPFNYIPGVGEQLVHSSLRERLFDFHISSVYVSLIGYGDAYDEYNVPLALIKTSLFGEYNWNGVSEKIYPFAVICFISFIAVILLELVAFVRVVFVKEASPKLPYKLLLAVTAASLLGGYLMFALSYNNFSAQDFRYSSLMIAVMAIFLGLWDDRLSLIVSSGRALENKVKIITILRTIILVVSVVFAASSAMVYILLGWFERH